MLGFDGISVYTEDIITRKFNDLITGVNMSTEEVDNIITSLHNNEMTVEDFINYCLANGIRNGEMTRSEVSAVIKEALKKTNPTWDGNDCALRIINFRCFMCDKYNK